MHVIQKDLVHTVSKDRCGNCGHPKVAHVEGACLFDFTTFRKESVNDHLDCECESVVEEGAFTTKPDGTLAVDLSLTTKKKLNYIKLDFSV